MDIATENIPRNIHIGTAGWNYKSWCGPFYPKKIAPNDMLAAYAKTFETVELNHSFYKLPEKSTVHRWYNSTPADFRFSCKASRYITHMKKLKDPKDSVGKMMDVLKDFEDKLGPILFQLPPRWKKNSERLENFLKTLPADFRYTFEFRDKSWLSDDIYELLEKHKAALCFYDLKGEQSPEVMTGDFVYMRLHGPKKRPYKGSYDGRTLAGYAQKFLRWADEGKDVFCFFDNDKKACAPLNAADMLESLNKQAA